MLLKEPSCPIANSSRSPTAGGQYHWVSEFAPPKYQKVLSYYSGWLTAIGWQVYLASVCFLVGTLIQGMMVLNNADYVFERWHGTLLTLAVVIFTITFNTALANKLPIIGKLGKPFRRTLLTHRTRGIDTDPPHSGLLCCYCTSLGHGSKTINPRCALQLCESRRLVIGWPLSHDRLVGSDVCSRRL